MNAHTATARAEKTQPVHIGDHLREWRQRRHLSQLDLAGDAEISARHLSFVETGRAAPSRDMVLKLAERLEVPLRERNVLLVAAGFAPAFPQRSLDDPALKSARAAIDLVLRAHEPNPALAYDRQDRKSTRLNSSHQIISYAVFCLKKKNNTSTIALC